MSETARPRGPAVLSLLFVPVLVLPLVVSILVGGACDEESPVQRMTCNGVTRTCHWNPNTRAYDKDCIFTPPDGGYICDGGLEAAAD